MKGANTVIHLGPSGSLEDYHQESGRIGRDSQTMSHAILFKYKGCRCRRNISKPMKNYVRNVSHFRRVILNSSFNFLIFQCQIVFSDILAVIFVQLNASVCVSVKQMCVTVT